MIIRRGGLKRIIRSIFGRRVSKKVSFSAGEQEVFEGWQQRRAMTAKEVQLEMDRMEEMSREMEHLSGTTSLRRGVRGIRFVKKDGRH